jgi:pyruvate dehydrogenase E1 component alpha subunit
MPALRVDGHDVLAVREAVSEAVARARAGEGPTFVEAVTYRSAPHATADDPSLYIDPERVAAEEERDCVAIYEAYLERLGVLDHERRAAVKEEALAAMRIGIQAAEDEPAGGPGLVFAHAYAHPPASLGRDLDELRRVHGL